MNDVPPNGDRVVLPADRQRVLKEHLMREIQHQPDRRPGPVRRFLIPAATSATAAAAVIAALVLSSAPTRSDAPAVVMPPGTHAQAVDLLDRIATVAYTEQIATPRGDQFIYIDSKIAFATIGPKGSSLAPEHRRQIWTSVNGSRAGLLKENGRTDPLTASPGSLNDPTYAYLGTLPTDPSQLLALIKKETAGTGTGPDAEAFTTIGDLLRESLMPPKLSAALYRAAALIPGVVQVQDSTDAIGRHGVAVARVDTTTGQRQEWIFDSGTLRFLGERDIQAVTVHGSPPVGTVFGETAVLGRAIVDHPGQTS